MRNIVEKENYLLKNNIIPKVAVCGAGASGIELAFSYKSRWSKLFGQPIEVTIITSRSNVLEGYNYETLCQIQKKIDEHGINVVYNEVVKCIEHDGVVLESGLKFFCNVPVWATGAEPQQVTIDSDLDILKGYFRVNDFLQSTSHPNIFAGGDCISIESFAQETNFPPKAGIYAIREGPIIAQNIVNMIKRQPLVQYVP